MGTFFRFKKAPKKEPSRVRNAMVDLGIQQHSTFEFPGLGVLYTSPDWALLLHKLFFAKLPGG